LLRIAAWLDTRAAVAPAAARAFLPFCHLALYHRRDARRRFTCASARARTRLHAPHQTGVSAAKIASAGGISARVSGMAWRSPLCGERQRMKASADGRENMAKSVSGSQRIWAGGCNNMKNESNI